jgi:CRISPR-associated protein Csm2
MAYANPSNRSGAPRRDNDGWQHPTSPPLDTSGIDLCPPPGQSLNPDLFDGIARRVAKAISDADRYRNKPSQLRQFYDELVMWEEKARQTPERFADYLPFIRMLNAKAAYAEGRKHVDKSFVDLMAHGLKQVTDPAALRHFKLFFEAFLGFYKAERPSG